MRMRKKRRGQERMTALDRLFVKKEDFSEKKRIFAEDKPLCLEIGCGKGDFIRQLSARDGEFNYVAMEKVADVAVVACEKYATDRGLGKLSPHGEWQTPEGDLYDGAVCDFPMEKRGNVRFMVEDAALIDEIFPEGEIEHIYANFSDPWPKKGYESRRLTHPVFLKKYLKLLKKGGLFTFKTDNAGLFDFSVESIKADPAFEVVFETRDLHESERKDTNIITEYERNFSSQGVKINCIEARKI